MAELPERYRALDAREGVELVGHRTVRESRQALKRSLPTMHHAARMFERACELLGARGWVDPVGGEARQELYLDEPGRPGWRVASPLLERAWAGATGRVVTPTFRVRGPADALVPDDAPEGWTWDDAPYLPLDPKPEVYPRAPEMRAGSLRVSEGAAYYEIAYGDDGLYAETSMAGGDTFHMTRYGNTRPWAVATRSRPPTLRPVSLLLREDLDPRGHPIDDLARMLIEGESAARVPGRVLLPLPVPGGLAGAWTRGLHALRRALWEGRVPAAARLVIVDAFDHAALAWGEGFDDAHAAWRSEVERVRPKPPRPLQPSKAVPKVDDAAPDEPPSRRDVVGIAKALPPMTFHVTGPTTRELPWPLPVPRHVPAVAAPVARPPSQMPAALDRLGFREVRALLGAWGAPSVAWLRPENDGWTLVGDGIANLVDASTFDDEMSACERAERHFYENESPAGWHIPWRDPRVRAELQHYSFWDNEHQRIGRWRATGGTWSGELDIGNLDGDALRWAVARFRRLRE